MNKTLYKVILVKESEQKKNHYLKLKEKNSYLDKFKAIYWKNNLKEAKQIFSNNRIRIGNNGIKRVGVYCIWASNIKLWLQFLRNPKYKKYKYLVVLEDDVIIKDNFRQKIQKKIINSGLLKRNGAILLTNLGHATFLGVIYKRSYIKKILQYLRSYGIRRPIDIQMLGHKIVKRKGINFIDYNRKIKSERRKSTKI